LRNDDEPDVDCYTNPKSPENNPKNENNNLLKTKKILNRNTVEFAYNDFGYNITSVRL